MPSDLVKRIDLDRLWLPFTERLLEALARCRSRGANYYAVRGWDSFATQGRLYFQGRTTPGQIVTNAPAGMSLHNYGLATDAVRDHDMAKTGLQPYWGADGYAILEEECKKVGLQAGLQRANGAKWDHGHVQVPVDDLFHQREKEVLLQFKAIYTKAMTEEIGLRAVWDEMDKIPWA